MAMSPFSPRYHSTPILSEECRGTFFPPVLRCPGLLFGMRKIKVSCCAQSWPAPHRNLPGEASRWLFQSPSKRQDDWTPSFALQPFHISEPQPCIIPSPSTLYHTIQCIIPSQTTWPSAGDRDWNIVPQPWNWNPCLTNNFSEKHILTNDVSKGNIFTILVHVVEWKSGVTVQFHRTFTTTTY